MTFPKLTLSFAASLSVLLAAAWSSNALSEAQNVYFGDTHVHSALSADASLMGNRSATPDVAYRYAKGLPVVHPQHRNRVQMDVPLDFLVVSDHAEFLGLVPALLDGDKRMAGSPMLKKFKLLVEQGKRAQAFGMLVTMTPETAEKVGFLSPEVSGEAWQQMITAAEQHNKPGEFTSLIGWEWSAMPRKPGEIRGPNLHRVVFMREGGDTANKFTPFSSDESDRPEDLWAWLSATAKEHKANFIAMPHNSNIGLGKMFDVVDSDGEPISAAYAAERMRWEPVVEATQFKGDSETHPQLSPEDEFAGYELFILAKEKVTQGDFVRGALRRGLEIESRVGANPYQFGLIGASDSHTGLASVEEQNFLGKWTATSTPEQLLKTGSLGPYSKDSAMGAAGLAAVWANDNTREELFDAFKRREVYSTTGTRLKVRLFAGYDFKSRDLKAKKLADIGYKKGVPMGSELQKHEKAKPPTLMVSALKDPVGANLDRIQIIKGWVNEQGESFEKIYNVALSDERTADASGTVPMVGNTVDIETGQYTNTIGAAKLATVWKDPDYSSEQRSVFYYARVLEIPTPRYSLLDSIAINEAHPDDLPATIQERAYTSPVWLK